MGCHLARSGWASVRLLVGAALLGTAVVASWSTTPTPTSTPTTARTTTTTTTIVGAAPELLWSQDGGTTSEWSSGGGGGLQNSGSSEATESSDHQLNGSYSLRARIWTPTSPDSGVRAFRWQEPRAHRELYFSTWIYIPQRLDLTANFLNLFQFKSRSQDGSRNDPVWGFYGAPDGNGGFYLRAGWGWGGTPIAGPHRTDGVGGKWFEPSRRVSVPVGRWVHLQAFLRQSKDFDGRLRLWQDGVQLLDLDDVRTSFDNCNYNRWCASNEWSVNLYSDGLTVNPATMYIDNSAIARSYIRAPRQGRPGSADP